MVLDRLSQIVTADIAVEAAVLTPPGFGRAMIVGEHTRFAERARLYTSLAAMLADGFLTTDPEYVEAQALLSQSGSSGRRVTDFYVGRRLTPVAQVDSGTVVYDAATTYTLVFAISGIADVTLNVPGNTSDTQTRDDIVAAINGDPTLSPLVLAAPVATDQFTVTSLVAGVPFTITESVAGGAGTLVVTTTTPNVGIQEDLVAILAAGFEWYCTLLTSRIEREIVLAAAWTESTTPSKILLAQSNEAAILAAAYNPLTPFTDVASELKAAGYNRTALMYHGLDSDAAASAWAGYVLPFDPGTVNWAHKSLVGLTPSDLTDTELQYVTGTPEDPTSGKNANVFIPLTASTNRTLRGMMASGRFCDVQRFVDETQAEIVTSVANKFLSLPKIPYDQRGIDIIRAAILEPLNVKRTEGLIDGEVDLTMPTSAEVSASDRTNRILTGITGSFVYAGAINKATINFTMS